MKTSPDINPIIEKFIDDKEAFNKINSGKIFYIGKRKYKCKNL